MNDNQSAFTLLDALRLSIPVIIALTGWFIVHRLNSKRDIENKRRELRTKYLIEAFRRIEAASNRKEEKDKRDFESAMADIQLFGTENQIQLAQDFMKEMADKSGALVDGMLEQLRKDLRRELNIEHVEKKIIVFRLK